MLKKLVPIWLLIGALIVADVVGLSSVGLSIGLPSLLTVVGLVAFLFLLALVYTKLRPDQRLANLSLYAATLFAYSAVAGLFGYFSVTWHRPLIDEPLNEMDRTMGLDWIACYQWVIQHPVIHLVLALAYNSILFQIAALIIILVTLRRFDRLHEFIAIYIVSSLIYIVAGGLLPAMGAFGHYHVGMETPYVRDFIALRQGTLGAIDMLKIQGLVQFPSFHLALAVIYTYALRGVKFWFALFAGINALLALSTPAIGGHYFADLWGSLILLPLIMFGIKKILRYNSTITGT